MWPGGSHRLIAPGAHWQADLAAGMVLAVKAPDLQAGRGSGRAASSHAVCGYVRASLVEVNLDEVWKREGCPEPPRLRAGPHPGSMNQPGRDDHPV